MHTDTKTTSGHCRQSRTSRRKVDHVNNTTSAYSSSQHTSYHFTDTSLHQTKLSAHLRVYLRRKLWAHPRISRHKYWYPVPNYNTETTTYHR